jgi:hypothetical protein
MLCGKLLDSSAARQVYTNLTMLRSQGAKRGVWTIRLGIFIVVASLLPGWSLYRQGPSLSSVKDLVSALWQKGPSACPSPFEDRRSLHTVVYAEDECATQVTVDDTPFRVTICAKPALCNAVTITIAHSDPGSCFPSGDRRLSSDLALDTWVREYLGPYEFRITVDGAEKYSRGTGVYNQTQCSYRFDIALQTAGAASLRIWQFFEVRPSGSTWRS